MIPHGLARLCYCGLSGYGSVLNTCAAAPAFWKRYVDNTFMVLPREQVQQFHDHLNSIGPVTVAWTLHTREDWICESAPDRDVEKRRITRALSSSGYPTALVKKNWHLKHSTPLPLLNWTHAKPWSSPFTSSTCQNPSGASSPP